MSEKIRNDLLWGTPPPSWWAKPTAPFSLGLKRPEFHATEGTYHLLRVLIDAKPQVFRHPKLQQARHGPGEVL